MRPTIHDKWDHCVCSPVLLHLEAGDALIVPSALCGIPIMRGIPILPDPAPMLILPRAHSTRQFCSRCLELPPSPRVVSATSTCPRCCRDFVSVQIVTICLRCPRHDSPPLTSRPAASDTLSASLRACEDLFSHRKYSLWRPSLLSLP